MTDEETDRVLADRREGEASEKSEKSGWQQKRRCDILYRLSLEPELRYKEWAKQKNKKVLDKR